MSKTTSTAAKELSKLGAPKGGRARANVLTAEERSEIARNAARARWAGHSKPPAAVEVLDPEPTPTAPRSASTPHSIWRGKLSFGDVEIECHVLSDRQRVLTQREVVRVLSGGRDSSNLVRYLERNPFYEPDLLAGRIVEFDAGARQLAHGYDAELLIEICDMYLKARDAGQLHKSQLRLARMAEVVVRACAKVGIIALIDEATGYQEVRAKQALQVKLQAFIADELGTWAKMFPDEFWYELARLEGIRYSPRNRPLRWGKYVMAFVYDAMDEDVGNELRRRNPNPHYRQNHHQWLKEFGRDKVNNQIQRVIAIMALCRDMDEFRTKFAKVFSKARFQMTLEGVDWSAMEEA